MKRWVAAAAMALLVVGSWTLSGRSAPTTEVEAVANPSTEPTPPASPSEVPTPGRVAAILASTGVPLEVRQPSGDQWIVATPCEDVAVVAGTPIGPFEVVLDPGHGGPVDTGAVGANGLKESTVNLQVAASASRELAARGISVLLTRNDNYAITLPTRVALAEAVDADLLVSIHHNAPRLDPSPGPGTEVYVQSDSPGSVRLGALLQDRVVTALSAFDVPWVGASDAGVLQVQNPEGRDAYGMVRLPAMPAVLLELGYLANPAEADLFASQDYLDTAGGAIADAAEAWLRTDQTGATLRPAERIRDPGASAATRDCLDPALQ